MLNRNADADHIFKRLESCTLLTAMLHCDGTSGTALQEASEGGHLEIAKPLLEHGADVNVAVGTNGTALHAASYKGHLKIIKLLLEKGASSVWAPESCTWVICDEHGKSWSLVWQSVRGLGDHNSNIATSDSRCDVTRHATHPQPGAVHEAWKVHGCFIRLVSPHLMHLQCER